MYKYYAYMLQNSQQVWKSNFSVPSELLIKEIQHPLTLQITEVLSSTKPLDYELTRAQPKSTILW